MKRSTVIVLAMGVAVMAQAQVSTVNSMYVQGRVFNDFPGSSFSATGTLATGITLTDNNVGAATGWANRHLAQFSADGGASPFSHPGGADTFEMTMDVNLTSNGTTGGFPRRVEAGPFIRMPVDGGWVSEIQMIITNDGEVAAFGTPIPFYSFTGSQSLTYTQGTTTKIGYRYFRDTDGKYKWVWIFGTAESPALTMEGSLQSLPFDFTTQGIRPPYIDGGNPRNPQLGMYFQVMPNGAPAQTVNASFAMSNIVLRDFGIKGNVTLQNVMSQAGKPVSVTVEDGGGNVLQSFTTNLDANGRITMKSTVAAGTYNVFVTGPTHLTRKISNVVFSADTAKFTASLLNGDVNSDNEVSPADFAILAGAFGSFVGDPNYLVNADLNGDGEVGPADFSILAGSFGEFGD